MYQWIIILFTILFFIFISVQNRECFSVGIDVGDISISDKLVLDTNMCCDDNLKCDQNSDCIDANCFLDPTKINIDPTTKDVKYDCSGNCKNGNKTTGQLCISDTQNTIDNIMSHGNTFLDFVKTNLSDSNTILCSEGDVCNPLPLNYDNWKNEYNDQKHNDDKVKSICSNYLNLSNPQAGNQITLQTCAIDLNIGTCKSN